MLVLSFRLPNHVQLRSEGVAVHRIMHWRHFVAPGQRRNLHRNINIKPASDSPGSYAVVTKRPQRKQQACAATNLCPGDILCEGTDVAPGSVARSCSQERDPRIHVLYQLHLPEPT